jgi:hypothetical protein
MMQRRQALQIARKCTQCKVMFSRAVYCTACNVIYCDECRHINLTPYSAHVIVKNIILCKRCFMQTFQSAEYVKQSGIWPCIDMTRWVHTLLTIDEIKAAAIVYQHKQEMLSIQKCMGMLVVVNPSQSNSDADDEYDPNDGVDDEYDEYADNDEYDDNDYANDYDIYDMPDLDSP